MSMIPSNCTTAPTDPTILSDTNRNPENAASRIAGVAASSIPPHTPARPAPPVKADGSLASPQCPKAPSKPFSSLQELPQNTLTRRRLNVLQVPQPLERLN